MLVLTMYFLYLDKNWFNLFLVLTVLGTASLLFMLLVAPENPKWLLAKGRRDEAISAFNKIASFNRSN